MANSTPPKESQTTSPTNPISIESLQERVTHLEAVLTQRIDGLEGSVLTSSGSTIDELEERLQRVDERIETVEERIQNLEWGGVRLRERIEEVNNLGIEQNQEMRGVKQASDNLSEKIDNLTELTTTLAEKMEIAELRIKNYGERTESLEKRVEMIANLLDEEKQERIIEVENLSTKTRDALAKVVGRLWVLETMAEEVVGDGKELRGRIVELERDIRQLRLMMVRLG
jgi:chromosome segregation ATPase